MGKSIQSDGVKEGDQDEDEISPDRGGKADAISSSTRSSEESSQDQDDDLQSILLAIQAGGVLGWSKEYTTDPWWPAIIIKSWSVLRYLPTKTPIECEEGMVPDTKRLAFFLGSSKHQLVEKGWVEEGWQTRQPKKELMEKKDHKNAVDLGNKIEKHLRALDPCEMEKIGKALAKGNIRAWSPSFT